MAGAWIWCGNPESSKKTRVYLGTIRGFSAATVNCFTFTGDNKCAVHCGLISTYSQASEPQPASIRAKHTHKVRVPCKARSTWTTAVAVIVGVFEKARFSKVDNRAAVALLAPTVSTSTSVHNRSRKAVPAMRQGQQRTLRR